MPSDGDARPRRSRSASTSPARSAARSYDELAPRNFSFNSPYGACEACDGLGTTFEVDPELVIPDPDLSINDGAIAPWRTSHTQYFTRMLEAVAEAYEHRPRRAVAAAQRQAAEGRAARRRGQAQGQVQEPLRPHARSTRPRTRASSRGSSVATPAPRATGRASSTRATCARCRAPTCGGRPAEAGVAGGHGRRPQHRRGLRHVDRRVGQVPRRRSS